MKKKILYFSAALLFLTPNLVFAVGSTGFENASFSAKSIGESNAVVAQADEPAAISYNPAGLTQLKGFQAQTSQDFIGVSTFYSGPNSAQGQSGGTLSYVPTAYVTMNPGKIFDDRVTLGIGSDSPFGLANKYDSTNPMAQFVGYKNAIRMFTVKPAIAIKLHDRLSIGGGPMMYRLYDLNTVAAYPLGGTLRAQLSGTSWGWYFGALANPWDHHQFGFYFRSPVHMNLHGHVNVENSAVLGNYQTGAYGKIDFPLNMTWAYAYMPNDKWTVESDFGYTRWSIHRRLYLNHDSVGNATEDGVLNNVGLLDKDYQDGYSVHLGTNYNVTKKLSLRAGSLFYWAVIPNDHWSAVIPDANRLGFTLGFGYKFTSWLNADVAYLSSFNLRRKIDNNMVDAVGQTLDGRYFSYVHGLYISISYKWEDIFERVAKKDNNETKPIPIITEK